MKMTVKSPTYVSYTDCMLQESSSWQVMMYFQEKLWAPLN